MRWGKTKLAIDVAGALYLKYGITRVLCVTTTSGLGVWEKEIPKHCPFPVRVISYDGTIKHDQKSREPAITFYVIHHALLYGRDFDWGEDPHEWTPGPNKNIEDFDPEFIVMDESHRIGDPSSMQCKMAYRYGKSARFRLTMTGTKFHRGPLMVFGQFKFMDDSVFGTTITAFKRMYVRYGGYGNYEIVGYQNLGVMSTKIKRKVFVQEYVAHTDPVVSTTPVGMAECKTVYDTMQREAVVTVNGHTIFAPIILTKHLRTAQIAGGWLKTEEGQYIRVGQEKRRALDDRLKLTMEEGIDKIVIGCMFIPEIMDIAKACKDAGYAFVAMHGGVPRGTTREQRIAAFNEATIPTVFVAQIQSAAEAIDLSSAQDLWFYSMPHSYLLYDQFKARIEKYREMRTLRYDHFIMQNSVDVIIWLAMNLKIDVAQFLLRDPELVERITKKDETVYHASRFQNVQ